MSILNKTHSALIFMLLLGLTLLSGCGEDVGERIVQVPVPRRVDYANLSDEEIDYIERFNVTAKNIRDFPPKKTKLEKYFYIYSNTDYRNAKYLLFGEQHTNSASQLWTAGAINELINDNDIVLFEGAQSKSIIPNITELFITDIFAAREFELRKTKYTPTSISRIRKSFQALFDKTKEFLTIDILKLYKGKGYFWDLRQGAELHPELAKRNEEMVKTMRWAETQTTGKIFVNTGAGHLPHYEFAKFIYKNRHKPKFARFKAFAGVQEDTLNDAFFDYFAAHPSGQWGSTVSIFNYLKGKDFAVFIPKICPAMK